MVPLDSAKRHTDEELPDTVVTDLLGPARRRYALDVLVDRDEPVVIDDLAAAVLACERETSPDAIDDEDRRAIRDEFFQRHLPKFTATELVEYNSMLGTVELNRTEYVRGILEEY